MKYLHKYILLFLIFLLPADASAKCAGSFLNPITDVCWSCMFPIKIAGIKLGNSNIVEPPDPADKPVCFCPAPPPAFVRIGLPISFWEPARFVETVKDPYCFPSLGTGFGSSGGRLSGSSSEHGNQEDSSYFGQAHYFIFAPFALMELLVDFICLENVGLDIAYITEVDPLWNNDQLALIISPEALLFANPVAQISCVADSVSANAGLPLPYLFWCMGSWGSAYPLSGNVNDGSQVQGSAAIAARMIYKLGREFLLWDYGLNLCSATPTPIWVKWNYRLQLAKPVRGGQCVPIGRSEFIWGGAKNPPTGKGDNFLYMIFRKRACCAF